MAVRLLLFGLVAHLTTTCTRGWILRGCFTYANFSYVMENRVLQGSVMVTLQNKSPKECKEACIAEFFCKSINIEDGGDRKCELCRENVNDKIANLTLTAKAGWTHKSTDYNDIWIGPFCKKWKPCSVGHVCTDTCNCPGYICHPCTAIKIGIDCLKRIVIEGIALGLEDSSVLDYQMSSSSEFALHEAYRGRLNFPGRWCAEHGKEDKQHFLRVDFILRKIITDIAIQGHDMSNNWVKTYQLLYTEDHAIWQTYEEDGTNRTFDGSLTAKVAEKQSLRYYIRAFSIKINPRSWQTHICMRIELYGIDDILQPPKPTATAVTGYPLGIQTTTVKNYQMSTSSDIINTERAYHARLHHGTRWCAPLNNQPQYIRVDFPTRKIITDVAIQGHHSFDGWVISYQLHYTEDSYAWQPYQQSNGSIITFLGVASQNTVAKRKLPLPVRAFGIKLNPREWHRYICMRLELYGIEDPSQPKNPKGCYSNSRPLGMASGLLPNERITASSNSETARNARINLYNRWCEAHDSNILNEYIQVDLGKKFIVNAVSTQGHYYLDYWVKKYYIGYSDTSNQFSWIMNGTTKKMFSGNSDRNWIVKNEINPPVNAQYIRINPQEYNGYRSCLRLEIHGCYM